MLIIYMDTKQKYIKYKNKKQSKLIIHISGPSGSGKTTLGNKLKDKFGDVIVVMDFDDIFNDFMNINKYEWGYKFDPSQYQKYIDDRIDEIKKPLVLVGLNLDMWHNPYHYYESRAQYKFYIDIPAEMVLKQKFDRTIDSCFGHWFRDSKEEIFKNLMNNETETIKDILKGFEKNFRLSWMKNEIDEWNRDYKKMGYRFLSREDIFREIVNLDRIL